MEAILELASQLGKRIAEHPRGKTFNEAKKAVADDPDARALLKEFNELAQRIQIFEAQQKPIEPEDKRKLADAQQRISGNSCLANYAKAQADYIEMMQHISDALQHANDAGD